DPATTLSLHDALPSAPSASAPEVCPSGTRRRYCIVVYFDARSTGPGTGQCTEKCVIRQTGGAESATLRPGAIRSWDLRGLELGQDRKSTRLNSSHVKI